MSYSFDQQNQLDKLKKFRQKIQGTTDTSSRPSRALWRPKVGESQIIRVVPDPSGDAPINELKFYFNTGVKEKIGDRQVNVSILSPSNYDESDPIEMFADIFSSENSDEYASLDAEIKSNILYKLRPSTKYYLPVIVRGKESDGVQYWGVSEKLLGLILDKIEVDGNLIYDPNKGRDMKVWIEDLGSYKQTRFELGKESPLSITQEGIQSIINSHPSLIDQFSKKSFNELKEIVNNVLSPYVGEQVKEEVQSSTGTDYSSIHKAAPQIQETPEPIQEKVEDDAFDDLPF